MRNDEWLVTLFNKVWSDKFSDVERKNNVAIRWKGKWKNKFGHIRRLKNGDTEIAINKNFQDERVPEFIVELTVAHELVHYMHGFHSPHPKLFKHPHKGGVVNKELKKRGYSEHLRKDRGWFRGEWQSMVKGFHNNGNGRITVKQLRNSFRLF